MRGLLGAGLLADCVVATHCTMAYADLLTPAIVGVVVLKGGAQMVLSDAEPTKERVQERIYPA